MASGNQTVHNATAIYCGEKFYGPPKKGTHKGDKFAGKNKFKPMIKNIDESGII